VPECGTKVEREALPEETAAYRCVNTECDAFYERKKVKRANLPENARCARRRWRSSTQASTFIAESCVSGAGEGAAAVVLRANADGY